MDFVLLPYLESIGLLQLAFRQKLFGGRPWATIAIGIHFHHRKCGVELQFRWTDILQNILFRRVIRDPTLVCCGTIDPYLSRFEERRSDTARTPPPSPT